MNGSSVKRQIGLLAGIVIIAAIALMLSNRQPTPSDAAKIEGPAIGVSIAAVADGDTVLADTLEIEADGTVLRALEAAAGTKRVPLGTRAYSFGILVVSIGGFTAGADGDWTYRVNDTMVPVAANSMHLQDGDRVLFRFGPGQADSLADSLP